METWGLDQPSPRARKSRGLHQSRGPRDASGETGLSPSFSPQGRKTLFLVDLVDRVDRVDEDGRCLRNTCARETAPFWKRSPHAISGLRRSPV